MQTTGGFGLRKRKYEMRAAIDRLKKKLGSNTVRRLCGRARQLFRAAMKRKLITNNPFGEMKGTAVQPNRSREYFVTRAEADKVLAACPDTEWSGSLL